VQRDVEGSRQILLIWPRFRTLRSAELLADGAIRAQVLLAQYPVLCALQKPFESIFWLIHQRKARLEERLGNEGTICAARRKHKCARARQSDHTRKQAVLGERHRDNPRKRRSSPAFCLRHAGESSTPQQGGQHLVLSRVACASPLPKQNGHHRLAPCRDPRRIGQKGRNRTRR
jgi:hypothetical protein